MKTATARTSLNSTKTSAAANPPCGNVGDRTSAPTTMTSCVRCTENRNQMKTCEFHPDGTVYKVCGEPATRIVLIPHADDCRTMHVCDSCFLLGIAWWEKCGIEFEL